MIQIYLTVIHVDQKQRKSFDKKYGNTANSFSSILKDEVSYFYSVLVYV